MSGNPSDGPDASGQQSDTQANDPTEFESIPRGIEAARAQAQRRRARQRLRQRVVDQTEGVDDPEQVRVRERDDGGLIASLNERARKQVAAQNFAGEVDGSLSPSDIVIEDGQASLAESARRRLAAQAFSDDTGESVAPEDVTFGDDGSAQLSPQARKRLAVDDLSAEVGQDLAVDDVQLTDDGTAQLSPQARRELAAQEFSDETEMSVAPEDVTLTDDGSAQLTDEAREDLSVQQQFDFDAEESWTTEEERQQAVDEAISKLESQGYDPENIYPDVGPAGDVDATVNPPGEEPQYIEDVVTGGEGPEGPQLVTTARDMSQSELKDYLSLQYDIADDQLQTTTVDGEPGVIVSGDVTKGADDPQLLRDPEPYVNFDTAAVADIDISDERRQELREEAAADSEQFVPGDFEVEQQFDDIVATPTDTAQKELVAQTLSQQVGSQLSPSDIVLADDGAQLSEEAQKRLAADDFSTQLGMDVASEEVTLTEDGEARLTGEARQEQRQQLREEVAGQSPDFSPEDVIVGREDGQLQASVDPGAQLEEMREEIVSQAIQDDGDILGQALRNVEDSLSEEQLDTVSSELARVYGNDRAFRPDKVPEPYADAVIKEAFSGDLGADKNTIIDTATPLVNSGELTDQQKTTYRQEVSEASEDGLIDLRDLPDPLQQRLLETYPEQAPGDISESLAFDELQSQTDAEIAEQDIVETEDGFGLSDQAQREVAAEQISADLEDVSVSPDEVTLGEDGAQLSEEAQTRVGAEQLGDELNTDLTAEDVQLDDDEITLTDSGRQQATAAQLSTQLGIEVGAENVELNDEGGATLDPTFVNEITRVNRQPGNGLGQFTEILTFTERQTRRPGESVILGLDVDDVSEVYGDQVSIGGQVAEDELILLDEGLNRKDITIPEGVEPGVQPVTVDGETVGRVLVTEGEARIDNDPEDFGYRPNSDEELREQEALDREAEIQESLRESGVDGSVAADAVDTEDGEVVVDLGEQPTRDPANLGDAGRVEGGLEGLRFEGGRAILEETPAAQGLETDVTNDVARQLEQEFTEQTGLSADQVRIVENFAGEPVAAPTEQFEQDVESRAAERLGVTDDGVAADIGRDFSADTSLTRAGQRQRVARQLEQQLGDDVTAGEDFTLETVSEAERQRAFELGASTIPGGLTDQQRERLAPEGAETRVQLTDSFRRERAREQVAAQLEQQYGQDATAGEDFTLEQNAFGRFEADVTEAFERDVAQARRQGRRRAREQAREQGILPAQERTGETEVFIDEIPAGELANTTSQRQPTQASQAPGSFDRPSLETDEAVTESLTSGGLLADEGVQYDLLEGREGVESVLEGVSQQYQQGLDVVATGTGEIVDEVLTLGDADFGDNQIETAAGEVTQAGTEVLGAPGDVAGISESALTGEIVPSERDLQNVSEQYTQGLDVVSTGTGEVIDEVLTLGEADFGDDQIETEPAKPIAGVTQAIGEIGLIPTAGTQVAETGLEAGGGLLDEGGDAVNLGGEGPVVDVEEALETGEAAAALGAQVTTQVGRAAAQQAFDEPLKTIGRIGGGAVASYATGVALPRAIRAGRSRGRVAGSETVDEIGVSQRELVEGDEQFPSAQDPATYKIDPAEAVREQAQRNTPDTIKQAFEEAGVEDGVPLKKALPVEPEGPRRGRAAKGFESATEPIDETGIDPGDITDEQVVSAKDSPGDFSYENPGSFVSSDLSRYFLGDPEGNRRFSLRPGLPDFSADQSTVTVIKTDVDAPDADTQLEYAREMARREGETTAFTKPAGSKDLNVDEIEATIPPGAKFVDVGDGPIRNALRRLGIGADYSVEVEGRRVPVRLVAPESELSDGSRGLRDFISDERAQAGSDGSGSRVQRELRYQLQEPPTDRPSYSSALVEEEGEAAVDASVSDSTVERRREPAETVSDALDQEPSLGDRRQVSEDALDSEAVVGDIGPDRDVSPRDRGRDQSDRSRREQQPSPADRGLGSGVSDDPAVAPDDSAGLSSDDVDDLLSRASPNVERSGRPESGIDDPVDRVGDGVSDRDRTPGSDDVLRDPTYPGDGPDQSTTVPEYPGDGPDQSTRTPEYPGDEPTPDPTTTSPTQSYPAWYGPSGPNQSTREELDFEMDEMALGVETSESFIDDQFGTGIASGDELAEETWGDADEVEEDLGF